MARFYSDSNPYGETVEFDTGETIEVLRGQSASIDEDTRKLQQEEYELKQSLALQEEYDQVSEELTKQFPDGMGRAEAASKYLDQRIKQITENSPDQSAGAKTKLLSTLGNFQLQATRIARAEERQATKDSIYRTYLETKENTMGDVFNNPGAAQAMAIEIEDKVAQVGQIQKWTPEEIAKETEQTKRQLHHSAISGLIKADPNTAHMLLRDGYYDNVLKGNEKEIFQQRIRDQNKFNDHLLEAIESPSELIRKNEEVADSGQDPTKLADAGKASQIDLALIAQLRQKERTRMSDKSYAQAKQSMLDSGKIIMGADESDERFRLDKLRTLYDNNKLQVNAQAIEQINRETSERVTNRIILELQKSNYLSGDINKTSLEQVNNSKQQIAQDVKAGRLDRQKALAELKILDTIRGHISGR